jgi:hypothetical protein
MTTHGTWSREVRTDLRQAAFDAADAEIEWLAHAVGARGVHFPALIDRATLERAGYPDSFPHLLLSVESARAPASWYLSPAVCYHVYAQFEGVRLTDPVTLTARGPCFRAEHETQPGIRQIEFEMREIVFLGAAEWVNSHAQSTVERLTDLAGRLGLPGAWFPAEDPFFLPAGEGKALVQRLLGVKQEYRVGGANGLALASVNRHGTFFGERFDIRQRETDVPVHTACVAVGLDRWHAAITTTGTRRDSHDVHASTSV